MILTFQKRAASTDPMDDREVIVGSGFTTKEVEDNYQVEITDGTGGLYRLKMTYNQALVLRDLLDQYLLAAAERKIRDRGKEEE